MAARAELAILLQRFPDFAGQEGEERDWYTLARVVFEKHVPQWPIKEIRMFKANVPKMTHFTGTSTANRYHHKIVVAFRTNPSWALACCIKIMFGGWELLKNTAIGKRMKEAFPGHDCGSWECPDAQYLDDDSEAASESSTEKPPKKRRVRAKAIEKRPAQEKAGKTKRLKAKEVSPGVDDSNSPEPAKNDTNTPGISQDIGTDLPVFPSSGNTIGSAGASNIIKAEPEAMTTPTASILANSTTAGPAAMALQQPTLSADRIDAHFGSATEGEGIQTGQSTKRAFSAQASGLGSAQLSVAHGTPLNMQAVSSAIQPSIEDVKWPLMSTANEKKPQMTVDNANQRASYFSRIDEELQRLHAVNQLQLITHDGYVVRVAKLQEEQIVRVRSYVEQLERLN